MTITTKIAALFLCATLVVSCSKAPEESAPQSQLDWSQTSTITLGKVALASSTKADPPLMKEGQTFRLYAIDPTTKDIIATQTYTITGGEGKPVVDAPQEKVIALPFGVVDIFLVGPVKATLDLVEYEIATPTEVLPRRGVDLVSSLTRVTIRKAETSIDPKPLQHRMVKLEVAIQMEQDEEPAGRPKASYINAKMDDLTKHGVSLTEVSTFGTFVFNDQGGKVSGEPNATCIYTYTLDNTGERNLKQTSPGVEVYSGENTGSAYSAYDYVFPSYPSHPTLKVTYGYTFRTEAGAPGKDVPAHEMSGSPYLGVAWPAGAYLKIHTTLTPSIDMVVRPTILPWDEGGTTPIAPPTNNDLLFWYSGEDEPEWINGKLCWRDRSGNENHAIIEGQMRYDDVNKCYYSAGGYFRVPALGKVAEYTLELTAQSVLDAQNMAASFSGATGLYIHLPYVNQIVWYNRNPQQQMTYSYGNTDKYIFEQLNSYAFSRSSSNEAIIINGAMKVANANTDPWDDFNDNMLWSVADAAGKQRLYGAKMYKKYMNDDAGRKTLAANHAAKLSQLGVNAPLSGTTFDYVKDGLIVDLQGTDALSSNQWQDRSGKGNHAQVFGSLARNATSDGYVFPGNAANYMKLIKSLGNVPHITCEIVFKSTNASRGMQILVSCANDTYLHPGVNTFDIWWPYSVTDGALIDAPFSNSYYQRIWLPTSEMVNPVTTLSQLSLAKSTTNEITLRQNGYTYANKTITNNLAIPELKSLYIGGTSDGQRFQGEIYAIRIYNRALSDMERQHNYLIDKNKYKILP